MVELKKPDDPVQLGKLENKLNEYIGELRNKKKENPGVSYNDLLNTGSGYKAMVLGKVMFNEIVDTDRLAKDLERKINGFDRITYNSAVDDVGGYINNEGKNTIGGTGY